MSKKKWVPAVVVGAVIVLGYAGAAIVAKQKAREVVDRHLARLEARLEEQGREATITYDDVSIHGFSLRPEAVVHGLHIQLHDATELGEAIITTPEVHFYPHNFGMTTYHLTVPQNIEVSQYFTDRPREQTTVSYDGVPTLEVEEQAGNEHAYHLRLPRSIVITTLTETVRPDAIEDSEAGGEEVLPPIDAQTAETDRIEIGQAEDPQISWHTNKYGHPTEQKVLLKQVTVNHQYEPFFSFDLFSFDLTQQPANEQEVLSIAQEEEAGDVQVNTQLKLENLNFAGLQVLNPIFVNNDVTYTGPAWLNEQSVQKPGNVFSWDVKDVKVITGLASFFASGKVTAQPEKEKLPYGTLTLRFDDLKKLFEYLSSTRPKAAEGLKKLQAGIERISGANINAGDVVTVDLSREPGGRLRVGKLSLEEAFAVGFESMIYVPGILSAPVVAPATPATPGAKGEEPVAGGEVNAEGTLVTPLEVTPGGVVEGDESAIKAAPNAPAEGEAEVPHEHGEHGHEREHAH